MSDAYRQQPLEAYREAAIAMMKAGHAPEAIDAFLVSKGLNPNDVRALLTELVALKHQAAAQDPARLRAEATHILWTGGSIEHVVDHFVRAGIAAEHARPEAERIAAAVRRLRPCNRCGAPTPPEKLVFDPNGLSICPDCNLRTEIVLSEQRGIARALEGVGVSPFAGMIVQTATDLAGPSVAPMTAPFCAHCRQPTGVHAHTLHPSVRARLDPRWTWVCGRCWNGIG